MATILSENDYNILDYLAPLKEGIMRSFLEKNIDMDHTSLHVCIQRLMENNFIAETRTKGGGSPQRLTITKAGLLMLRGVNHGRETAQKDKGESN